MNDEKMRIKKDNKPYYIFACSKCGQYSYVKTTQKFKKCLRCGRNHNVANLNNAKIVFGMTAAMNAVKKKQNKLALEELDRKPDLLSFNTFTINQNYTKTIEEKSAYVKDQKNRPFLSILKQLSRINSQFPESSIRLLVVEYGIPEDEIPILISRFIFKGYLKRIKNGYLKVIKTE